MMMDLLQRADDSASSDSIQGKNISLPFILLSAAYNTIFDLGKYIFNQSEDQPRTESILFEPLDEPGDDGTVCSDESSIWWQQVTPLQHLLLNALIIVLIANLSLIVVSWWYYQTRIAYTLTRGRSAAVDEILRRHTATKSSRGSDK